MYFGDTQQHLVSRLECSSGRVGFNKVSYVVWGETIEGFESQAEYFEFDPLLNREPMKLPESGCNVVQFFDTK